MPQRRFLRIHPEPRSVLLDFPRPKLPCAPAQQEDAQPLQSRDQRRDPKPPLQRREEPVPAGSARKGQEDGDEKPNGNIADSEGAEDRRPGLVAVADGPADEVRVGLIAEREVQDLLNWAKRGGVSRPAGSMQHGRAVLVREIELARGAGADVMGNDPVDLATEGLVAGCVLSCAFRMQGVGDWKLGELQGANSCSVLGGNVIDSRGRRDIRLF